MQQVVFELIRGCVLCMFAHEIYFDF